MSTYKYSDGIEIHRNEKHQIQDSIVSGEPAMEIQLYQQCFISLKQTLKQTWQAVTVQFKCFS